MKVLHIARHGLTGGLETITRALEETELSNGVAR
jgi:hypothetical protein